ncbi:MAG: ABC transporter substrate-binding protein [Anaerolineaceae bacterium]|nr:ABC transporter substrate-binding protein [Anaerolineaceae bacterium]
MRTKKSYFVILGVLLISLLAACSTTTPNQPVVQDQPDPVEETTSSEEVVSGEDTASVEETEMDPVTIQVFYPIAVDAPITDVLNGYIADFQAEYPYITVEPVFSGGYADVQTAIQTTIDGGGQPPAMAVMLATALYDLINADYIVPMDGYINNMEDGNAYINDFLPAFLENSYYDDQLWSIPFQRSAVVLYYNVDMFNEAGIAVPNSWQSWAEAAQALTVNNGDSTNWGLQFSSDWPYWLFQPLAIGAGQNIFIDDCHVAFDDPAVIDAVQFYIDLSAEYGAMPAGVQANWATSATDFASGTTAMVAHSSGSLTSILNQAEFEVGVMPYPGKEADTYASVPGGGNFYILNGAPQEQQDAAWKFIEFLSRPEYVADYSIQTGYIANRFSAYETNVMQTYVNDVPQALATRDALQYAGAELALQNLGQVRGIFHDYIQRAINGEMSAADAMTAAQSEAEAALVDFCP